MRRPVTKLVHKLVGYKRFQVKPLAKPQVTSTPKERAVGKFLFNSKCVRKTFIAISKWVKQVKRDDKLQNGLAGNTLSASST